MSAMELIVIGFGLFAGYWVVSKLIADKPAAQSGAAAPWHEVLGVAPEASVEDIRAAYSRLMSASPEQEMSRQINAAYHEAMRLRGVAP